MNPPLYILVIGGPNRELEDQMGNTCGKVDESECENLCFLTNFDINFKEVIVTFLNCCFSQYEVNNIYLNDSRTDFGEISQGTHFLHLNRNRAVKKLFYATFLHIFCISEFGN